MKILPKTSTGKWSLWLFITSIVVPMLVTSILVPLEIRYLVHALMFLSWGILIVSGITAILSWFKYKDRALLLILPVLYAVFALMFIIGEVVSPH